MIILDNSFQLDTVSEIFLVLQRLHDTIRLPLVGISQPFSQLPRAISIPVDEVRQKVVVRPHGIVFPGTLVLLLVALWDSGSAKGIGLPIEILANSRNESN